MKVPALHLRTICLPVLLTLFLISCGGTAGQSGSADSTSVVRSDVTKEVVDSNDGKVVVFEQFSAIDYDARLSSAGVSNSAGFPSDDTSSRYSMDELEATRNRIVNSWSELEARGLIIASIGIDRNRNRVSIIVGASSSMSEVEFKQIFGDQVIYKYGPDTTVEINSRTYDSFPPRGGSWIFPGAGGWCTSGFVWTNDNGDRDNFVTAAHCTDTGDELNNGGRLYGTSLLTSFDFQLKGDFALVDTIGPGSDGYPHIYVGENIYRVVQEYWPASQLGRHVCFSGATTGIEKCGFVVTREDGCERFIHKGASILICGLTYAKKVMGNSLSIPGDSGGPVYSVLQNGKTVAAGIVTGTAGDSLVYTPVSMIMESIRGRPWTCKMSGGC